jgi:hypothetical protein
MRILIICFLALLLNNNEKGVTHGFDLRKGDLKNEYKYFVGKTIKQFLSAEKFKGYKQIVFVDSKPLLLSSIIVVYSKNIEVELIPNEFKYITPFNIKRTWDLEKMKMESIVRIIVYRQNKIILTIPE